MNNSLDDFKLEIEYFALENSTNNDKSLFCTKCECSVVEVVKKN